MAGTETLLHGWFFDGRTEMRGRNSRPFTLCKRSIDFDQCIEQLGKLHGKVKLWRDAVTQARGEAKKKQGHGSSMNEMQREAELLRQFGLFVRENCYYAIGEKDEEPARISNFIMEPLFHIEDENNATRIFQMRNMYDVCRVIELKESELCSLSNFQQKAGSLGNYVWLAKIDKLNRVKEYLYSKRHGRTHPQAGLECFRRVLRFR